ncbi:hypothetical protein [Sphingomonas baiyangensis]|uniref:Phytoene synthase n=1 Tax=Sphingomonas baiyangensis TaxID=2572576 RepID=A0A4U1L3K2_9SPHN|nr:hypothetical protein [Sphingomonas baiyangensis]TKD50695.1 hypothetical protein FBR43_07870 [Sphingomonas baiyangensis]
MVNAASTNAADNRRAAARAAERRLILSYAPSPAHGGLSALLALDDTLAAVPVATSEPMLAQMRYSWWHDALGKLDDAPAPAQPVLRALEAEILPVGIPGATLARIVEGWEALIEEADDDDARRAGHALRGETLFVAAGKVLGTADARLAQAGRAWALADLALRDGEGREAALYHLEAALKPRWSPRLRSLGALLHQAHMDLRADPALPPPAATPQRIVRLGWHRLTGR